MTAGTGGGSGMRSDSLCDLVVLEDLDSGLQGPIADNDSYAA